MDYFEGLEDPRIERGKKRQLPDIIAIALCAVISGADSWAPGEPFGRSKEEWLRTFPELPNGIPSHDTFGDVFSRLNPEGFQECFMEWSRGWRSCCPARWRQDGAPFPRPGGGPVGPAPGPRPMA